MKADERMRQFFGGNFHEEFADNGKTVKQIVTEYLTEPPIPSREEHLSSGIRYWLERQADDAALEHDLFSELGCYYHPPGEGIRTRQWLTELAERLAREAEAEKP